MTTSILSLLMALCMLVTPVAGMDASEFPNFAYSIDFSAQPGDHALGLVQTTDGQNAFYASLEDAAFYLTGGQAILLQDSRAISVPTSDLMATLSMLSGNIPDPTEEDLNALATFAQGVLMTVSPEAFTFAPAGEGFTLEMDVDALLADLNKGVPQVLTSYAAQLDPTVSKYTPYIFGQPVTCAQLAQMWPQLGLGEVRTGLTLKLAMIPQQDGSMTILGGVSGLTFIASIGGEGFDLRFTTPDGVSYQFDTADLTTVGLIASQAFSAVGSEAFMFTESRDTLESGYSVMTYEAHLNTTALCRDLNRGFAEAIRAKVSTVDALLEKYRSWIALFDPQLAQSLTAASLAGAFDKGLISLPHTIGLLTVTDDLSTRTVKVDGYLNQATVTGKICYGRDTAGSLLFTLDDRYDPFVLDVDFLTDYNAWSCSLSSSIPVFDAFSTLTVACEQSGYGERILVTTDTNALRLAFDGHEQYMELKVGPFNAFLREDEYDVFHVNVYHPEFFIDVHAGEEFIDLDSTFFGADLAMTDEAFTLNGYIQPDEYADRITFGLDVMESGAFDAYLHAGYDADYSITFAFNTIVFREGDDMYTFTPDYATGNYILALNGEAYGTIAGKTEGSQTTIWCYQGLDTTVTPICTIVVDSAPAPVALPDGAQQVDAMTFLEAFASLFE